VKNNDCNVVLCNNVVITMFGKIVIVNNEIDENKGTPESQTFKKKKGRDRERKRQSWTHARHG
jgi:hypothetical protein